MTPRFLEMQSIPNVQTVSRKCTLSTPRHMLTPATPSNSARDYLTYTCKLYYVRCLMCRNKYCSCAAPVCVDAGGTPYADGFTDSDGCSVRSQADADAVCEASETAVECGEYKCSFEADASGNGCGLNAGLMFSGECDQGAACQEGICDDAGACSLQEAGSFCRCVASPRFQLIARS